MAHSTQSTSESEAPISSTDMEFILLIMRGHASAYSIWIYMKGNPNVRPRTTAYKNINQRLTRLARIGLLEGEVKFDVPGSTRGRRDYKVTMEGLERLIPYLIDHPEELKSVAEYMDRFGLDIISFGLLLLEKYTHMSKLVHEYHKLDLGDVSGIVSEKSNGIYNELIRALGYVNKDIGAIQQKHMESAMVSVKLSDSKTNKVISKYYEEIIDKLERYNIELKIDDRGKDTNSYSLKRSYSAYLESRKKRDSKLVSKDMQALLKVTYIMPDPVKFLKDIANNIEALVVLPPGELENYYNSKNKTYNLTKTVDN